MFREIAPLYWAAGLSAIPLRPRTKIPAVNGWQKFAGALPTPNVQEAWLDSYAEGNIGLALGEQSGLVALDLDCDDPKVIEILDRLIPWTPWTRIGAKGSVRIFKYQGERTFRIKDEAGKTLFELLSHTTQIVLPPSIHPDTQMPYTADANLYEVAATALPLPSDFELQARQALIEAGFQLQTKGVIKVSDWVPAGGRDSAMTGICGLTAWTVMRGEKTLLEGLEIVTEWVHDRTEKVIGDPLDPEKARQKLMEFVRRDVLEKGKSMPKGWDSAMSAVEVLQAREEFGDVEDAWTIEDFLVFMNEEFAKPENMDPLAQASLVESLVVRVGKAENLSEIDIDLVLRYLHQATGRKVSIGAMRKQLRTMGNGPAEGVSHSEIANLLIEDLNKFGEVRFTNGQWYQWRGSHWESLALHEVSALLSSRYGEMPAGRRHSDHRGILRTAEDTITKELGGKQWRGINFANGFLTPDMQLLAHDPMFGCTYVLPYRYLENYPAPLRFFEFLDQVWGKQDDYAERVDALRQVIAATLFGYGPHFQRAVCFYGRPNTGKTVLADIVKGLVPDDAISVVPPSDWGDRFKPVQMAGKLINFCGELSESRSIPGDRFKSIIEGDEMSGEYKGMQVFKFYPTCIQMFCSNFLPKSQDNSKGFTRRWLFLTFTEVVQADKTVKRLQDQILADEREAIACWAVGGLAQALFQEDYTLPASHERAVSQLGETLNSVRFFLNSKEVTITSDRDDFVLEKKLYMRYYAFCRTQANVRVYDMNKFRQALEELDNEYKFYPGETNEGFGYRCLKMVSLTD